MRSNRRYFFEVSYAGTDFHGWQQQPGQRTVQGEIEAAMEKFIPGFCGITASGRTDTGVHCLQQFFHADLPESSDAGEVRHKLNRMLPPSISIQRVLLVRENAHARFDAFSRTYEYRITRQKNPFLHLQAYWFERPLDVPAMNEAAALMLEHTNFESFSRVRTEVNNFLCNITRAEWVEKGDLLVFTISANRFLRGMVRAVVGTLMDIGEGKRTVNDFMETLAANDRKKAGAAAPPEGLYLIRVEYPNEIFRD